jgi:two-component system, NtrC family, response regulator AtoC
VVSDFEDLDTDALGERAAGRRLQAVISVDGSVTTKLLPSSGEVTIGRSSSCDLVINHASVSRQHAMLRTSPLEIIDVGSRNGTSVRGTRLERGIPTAIAVGEAIQVGEASILIQTSSGATDDKPLVERASEQTDSLDLLRAECARSARTRSPFALVQLEIDEGRPRDAHALLRELLRVSDVVRNEGNGALQALLVDTRADQVEVVVSRMADCLREEGISARLGVARYPDDGVVAEQLLAHAYEQFAREPGAPPTAMDNVRGLIQQMASGELSILLTGETGVGKELCAEMIHRLSPRAARPFVKLNCSALVESLIESELFGHERGAFTGATSAHEGLLETGNGGTVFLDEIGELPLGVQSKLLRVLEEQLVRRVGASTARKVDVRFICATNRDLANEVDGGRFRRDLYYRINGVTLAIPPLRERRSEIVPLARAFARRARPGAALVFGKEVVAELEYHSWPGNIRELRNSIERAVLMSSGATIRPSHLALDTRDRSRDSAVTMPVELVSSERGSRNRISTPTMPMERISSPAIQIESRDSRPLANAVADLERQRIIDALEQCGGNQTRAARVLGISRNTLLARLEEFGLPRPRKAR